MEIRKRMLSDEHQVIFMDWKDRVYCRDITVSLEGEDVLLMGWVDAIRDHGNILFIHLRDARGLVQVVFDPIVSKKSCEIASLLREEYVVKVRGKVALRAKGTENPYLETGRIEGTAYHNLWSPYPL